MQRRAGSSRQGIRGHADAYAQSPYILRLSLLRSMTQTFREAPHMDMRIPPLKLRFCLRQTRQTLRNPES